MTDLFRSQGFVRRGKQGWPALAGALCLALAPGPAAPLAAVPAEHAAQMAVGLELFKGHVGSLLKEHCLACHGGEKTKGDFDLTTREGLLKGGAEGPDVVLGKAKESKLIKLLRHEAEPHMPSKKPRLAADAIARIAAWIDAGAPYAQPLRANADEKKDRSVITEQDRQFWSFQPLREIAPPSVKNSAWTRTPIDRFILARLEETKLKPSPMADQRTLVRRAYLDLTGLPPKPAEVETFLDDSSRDAYKNLIDHLLSSPHYGERWGRHWLDLARFAESHGYEQDYDRPHAYHYRDFVIQALNHDLPFDQFVQWQIAGDELAPDELLAWKATGFLAAGTHATQITANQAEKERYDELDDLAATIGTAMLGLTVGCARCHDHKFDPLPTADYYRFISTFTTTVRSDHDVMVDPPKYRREKEHWERNRAPLEAALDRLEKDELPARLRAWEMTGARPARPQWLMLDEAEPKSKGAVKFIRQTDGSFLARGDHADSDAYTWVVPTPVTGVTAVRLEALADLSLPKNGPGRADNGNFALSDFKLSVTPLGATNSFEAKFTNAIATFESTNFPVKAAIDGDGKSAWSIDSRLGTNHAALFVLLAPITNAPGSILTFTLKFEANARHAIGRPRLSLTTTASPGLDGDSASAVVVEAVRILKEPPDQRSAADQKLLLQWYRSQDGGWRRLNERLVAHANQEPQPEKVKVLVSSEGLPAVRLHTQGPDFYEKTYLLKRGDLAQKVEEAKPGFLQVAMRAPDQEKRWQTPPPKDSRTPGLRTTLARWITDAEGGAGHLLARVIVNRLWQHHFGRGIVATPSDFGSQGARPTHPELLDWLANELIQNGWRLKPMHKLIMTSAAYTQRSDGKNRFARRPTTPALQHFLDPDNLLLWHYPRRRLEAESIRDSILAVSGRLDPQMFGPGSLDEAMTRRSVYFTIKRSKLISMMVQFDAPDSLQSMGRRVNTTVAPQALLMLNHPHVRAAALDFARRLLAETSGTRPAIQRAFLAALGRDATRKEIRDSANFVASQAVSYAQEKRAHPELLALADFCQAMFGLNEFAYLN